MVYVTGDCHADFDKFSVKNFPEQKNMTRDDFVIVCGDFGLWHDDPKERERLRWLAHRKFTILFVDGNHENFDRLYGDEFEAVDFHGGKAHRIRDNIYHLMRGHVFNLEGKKFFAFGGASSHDIQDGILNPGDFVDMDDFRDTYRRWQKHGKMFRVKGFSWWEQEMPNDEELERGRQSLKAVNNEVDFVISHCAPQEVQAIMGFTDCDKLTRYFNELLWDGLKFTKWFFAHYHVSQQIMGKFICLYEQIIQIA